MEKEVEYAWDNYTVSWLKPCWHHAIQDTMIMQKAFKSQVKIKCITIRCKFFSLFIGQEPTTWPTSNCLQIMVYSNAMSFNCVCLQIIFCSRHAITLSWKWQLVEDISHIYQTKKKLSYWMMKQLWNSVIAKYQSCFVSGEQINYSLRPRHSASANNWSACHWQNTIFRSTLCNNF